MKENNEHLIVKVGDLIHHQGSKDMIQLSGIYINDTISDVLGQAIVTSISEHELYVTVNLKYHLRVPCDYCGKEARFSKQVSESYTFMSEQLITPELLEEETMFPIGSDGIIDIYEAVRDTILLHDDIQHICPECKARLSATTQEDEEEESISGNIVFK